MAGWCGSDLLGAITRAVHKAAHGTAASTGPAASHTGVVLLPFCGSFAAVLELCRFSWGNWTSGPFQFTATAAMSSCGWMQLFGDLAQLHTQHPAQSC